MRQSNQELAQLIGSRICHDLVSPIGAIGNGLELLALEPHDTTPEMSLIVDSLNSANARIRYFRFAFGLAPHRQTVSGTEVLKTLQALQLEGRFTYDLLESHDLPRVEVRQLFLALMCLETCLIHGGNITLQMKGDAWHLIGKGPRIRWDAAVWETMCHGEAPEIGPSNVQFALLPQALDQTGRKLAAESTQTSVSLWF